MPKNRITTTISPDLLRTLDAQLAGRGMTRSEAVAQAVEEWVALRVAEDRERVERAGAKIDFQADRLARLIREARISSEMMLVLFSSVSPPAKNVSREELRGKAITNIERGRKR